MDELPEDISAEATRLAGMANECCYRSDGYEAALREHIAAALLAERLRERERCAGLAKEVVGLLAENFALVGPAGIGRAVVNAIRS